MKFINRNLSSQLDQLRSQNYELNSKLTYINDNIDRKYDQLSNKTAKRMSMASKRMKKILYYFETLSMADIEKTREIMVENVRKAVELLKGEN